MLKIPFNSGWEFSREGSLFREPKNGIPVTLPHDAQILEPRNEEFNNGAGGHFKGGQYFYVKKFDVPSKWKGNNIILEFEGVYQWSEIRVNGCLLVMQPYGYSSFLVDITEALHYGRENKLTVFVNNSAIQNARWYSGAGIYRHVWLRIGGSTYIKPWGVQIKTDGISKVDIDVELSGDKNVTVRHTVYSGDKEITCIEGGVKQTFKIPEVLIWSLEAPNLYTVKTELISNGDIIDAETCTFGIRKIEFDVKNGFRLNGVSIKMKGGCVHHDNGLLGSASYDRAEWRKIELLKASGFNAVRCAHNPPAPAMLDACDRLGMLVIDESFDVWRSGINANDYHLFFEQWWERDLTAMIKRDFNHPSVIMWSVGNEIEESSGASDGFMWAKKLADFARNLDDTRPTTTAMCCMWWDSATLQQDNDLPDKWGNYMLGEFDDNNDPWGDMSEKFLAPFEVAGYNYQYDRYEHDHKRFPNRIIYGGETFPNKIFESWNATVNNSYVIGDFVWTAIDYLGESGIGQTLYSDDSNESTGMIGAPLQDLPPYPWHQAFCGDIDICGFKRPQSYYRDILWGVRDIPWIGVYHPENFGKVLSLSAWAWPPVTDNWTFPGYEGKSISVEVYSDADEVELLINGKSQGRKPAGVSNRNTACFDVIYEPGTVTAIAWSGNREIGRHELYTTGAPTAIRLTADRSRIETCGDISYITVEVVDENGNLVKYTDDEIIFEVSGAGVLQAVGSGDPKTEENYFGNTRRVYEGRAMVVIRSNGETGETTLKASSGVLKGDSIKIDII